MRTMDRNNKKESFKKEQAKHRENWHSSSNITAMGFKFVSRIIDITEETLSDIVKLGKLHEPHMSNIETIDCFISAFERRIENKTNYHKQRLAMIKSCVILNAIKSLFLAYGQYDDSEIEETYNEGIKDYRDKLITKGLKDGSK